GEVAADLDVGLRDLRASRRLDREPRRDLRLGPGHQTRAPEHRPVLDERLALLVDRAAGDEDVLARRLADVLQRLDRAECPEIAVARDHVDVRVRLQEALDDRAGLVRVEVVLAGRDELDLLVHLDPLGEVLPGERGPVERERPVGVEDVAGGRLLRQAGEVRELRHRGAVDARELDHRRREPRHLAALRVRVRPERVPEDDDRDVGRERLPRTAHQRRPRHRLQGEGVELLRGERVVAVRDLLRDAVVRVEDDELRGAVRLRDRVEVVDDRLLDRIGLDRDEERDRDVLLRLRCPRARGRDAERERGERCGDDQELHDVPATGAVPHLHISSRGWYDPDLRRQRTEPVAVRQANGGAARARGYAQAGMSGGYEDRYHTGRDSWFTEGALGRDGEPARDLGSVREPARETPVYAETDVLVVGGGPAGCAAAVAALRLGAEVTLVERYNHLGGLSTGGLVIWIDRMTDWEGRQVIAGIGQELLDRLPAAAIAGAPRELWGSTDDAHVAHWRERLSAFRDTVTWSPMIDPEWLKVASAELLVGEGVRILLHSWVAGAVVEGRDVRGVLFESKEGRRALLAKVVVDATGDLDVCAAAGARYESDVEGAGEGVSNVQHCLNTAWTWAGVDFPRWVEFKRGEPDAYRELMDEAREALGYAETPFVGWRDDVVLFLGPRLAGYSALRVADLTAVELESRRRMLAHLDFFRRRAPGFE